MIPGTPIDIILGRLRGVKKTGSDKWAALCPGHNDRHPSLSIREAEDGKILLHCWAGCSASEIVSSLGLSMADLFPNDDRYRINTSSPMRQVWNARDVLLGLAHEISVSQILIQKRDKLNSVDKKRLALAEERIDAGCRAAKMRGAK